MANISNHTFVDGVGDIRLSDGIVRMDMLALSPSERTKEGAPVPEFVDQLVMSPHAFVRILGVMNKTLEQMKANGIVTSKGEAVEAASKETSIKPTVVAEKPKAAVSSPNF